ncbi:hypothetical protein D6833_05800 [Candidatus Parcubacteria bacterium]|nr:MAG: hypothetical protein D6833_05800 [Candidatus Parcubacteria bacterium]
MSTTTLFVEHLLIGIQATVWLSLLLLSILGIPSPSIRTVFSTEWITVPVSLAIIYPLGIFVDNLADYLLKRTFLPRIRKVVYQREGCHLDSLTAMKVIVRSKDVFVTNYLNYIMIRMRLARSTTLNFLLISLALVLFTILRLSTQLPNTYLRLVLTEIMVGVGLSFAAFATWWNIASTFERQKIRAYRLQVSPGNRACAFVQETDTAREISIQQGEVRDGSL